MMKFFKTTQKENEGFALIVLIVALAVIAIWAGYYFRKPSGKPSVIETGNNAIEQTKQNNTLLDNQQTEIQKNLNGLEK